MITSFLCSIRFTIKTISGNFSRFKKLQL